MSSPIRKRKTAKPATPSQQVAEQDAAEVSTPPRVSVDCSIYGLAWKENREIVYGGGGGRSKTGIPNLLVHADIDASQGTCTTKARADPEDAVMALACHPSEGAVACAIGTDIQLYKLESGSGGKGKKGKKAPGKFTATQNIVGEPEKNVRVVRFSRDGSRLIGAGEGGFITLWSYPQCKKVGSFEGHATNEPVIDLDFDAKGLTFATVSWDKKVKIWKTSGASKKSGDKDGACLQTLANTRTGYTFRGVRFDPRDSNKLYTLESKSKAPAYITRWERAEGKDDYTNVASGSAHSNALVSFSISPDGRVLGAGSSEGHVVTFDATTMQRLSVDLQHSFFVSSLAFSPDSRLLATSGGDQQLRFLPVSTQPAGDLFGLLVLFAIVLSLVASFLYMLL